MSVHGDKQGTPVGVVRRSRRSESVARWSGAAVTVLLTASGCVGPGGTYESRVAEAAAQADEFVLPQEGAPVSPWDQVVVVCPYALTDGVPAGFENVAGTLDTVSSENAQWLLFRSDGEPEILRLARDVVDLCAGHVSADVAFDDSTRWTGRTSEGVVQLTVAE